MERRNDFEDAVAIGDVIEFRRIFADDLRRVIHSGSNFIKFVQETMNELALADDLTIDQRVNYIKKLGGIQASKAFSEQATTITQLAQIDKAIRTEYAIPEGSSVSELPTELLEDIINNKKDKPRNALKGSYEVVKDGD
jgi:hypothetical protein